MKETRSLRLIATILFLFSLHLHSHAQVVINEFCTANYTDWNVGGGEFEDWVEFYNPGAAPFALGGYWLSDRQTNPQKWQFPATASVPAGGYLVVLLSGTGDYNPNYLGYLNTNFKVTQTAGEQLIFSNASGTILESYDFSTLSPLQANHSYARTPNGSATWKINSNPSQNAANSGTAYDAYAQMPQLSVQAGYKTGPISVTITAEPGSSIYYTLNGNEPSNTSTLYTGPINISTTTVLRAVAYSSNTAIFRSKIETNTYFFGNDSHTIPVVSVSGSTLSDGSWFGDELMHIEFFNPDGSFLTEATGDSNEHGNDSNAYGQRGFDYVTRDALGYDHEVQAALFHHRDRDSFERLIFKAAANDNYPFSNGGAHVRDAYVCELSILGNMHLDERATEFCIVYINGAYWGVYDVREKVDDIDFTDHYYDQPDGFVDFIKTWGGTWNEYGSNVDWNALVGFITSNNMALQANYDYVLTQYNTRSLIDYFILNGYTVCTDWLNWNTAWWRGRHPQGSAKRWRYALWDNDATFGHYVNYTGVPSTQPTADPCQIENMGNVGGQGHVPVLNALFNNTQFTADYIQRYASLSNSIFSCEQMIHVLDSMVAVIQPEMTRQCQRWGGTLNGWLNNVQSMRNFINNRCNDEIVSGLEDCYNVTAYNVTLQIEGQGNVTLSSLNFTPETTPWTGIFFGDLPINISTPNLTVGCGGFTGWQVTSGNATFGDASSGNTTLTIFSDVTITAVFSEPTDGPVVLTTLTEPAVGGVITLNGVAQTTVPQNTSVEPASLVTISQAPNQWYIFDHWETANATIAPNANATTITINPCLSDTITAVYNWIPNYDLTVMVGPNGGGTVLMNGQPITPGLPWTANLDAAPLYGFTAVPQDEWSTFSHWMIGGSIINPDELSASILLQLLQDDTLIAVFNVTPHFTVTVVVDPPYSGTVQFANGYSTNYITTVELEANVPHNFNASPEPYWEFKNWSSSIALPVPGGSTPLSAKYVFLSPDTIVAHFSKEEFTMYIPNSITPNDDGRNDVFLPVGMAIDPKSYHLLIFNRWGEKVFESRDMHQPWTGDHAGGEYYVADQFYQYVLKVKSVHENAPREYTGSILVFR